MMKSGFLLLESIVLLGVMTVSFLAVGRICSVASDTWQRAMSLLHGIDNARLGDRRHIHDDEGNREPVLQLRFLKQANVAWHHRWTGRGSLARNPIQLKGAARCFWVNALLPGRSGVHHVWGGR